MSSKRAVPLAALGTAASAFAYASVVELRWFRLRRVDMPVLPPDARPLTVLHLSDAHLTPGQLRKIGWMHHLADLQPDLVINTGDSISHPEAVPAFLYAVGPLLDLPGVFVYGSNDRYAPQLKNPLRYLSPRSRRPIVLRRPESLPYRELGEAMTKRGWHDVNNAKATLRVGGLTIEVGGVDDSHIRLDRYEEIAGPVDPAADLHLGILHSPEPSVMDCFVADGYDALFAGHTHGGQVCVPGYGALVTNCGIDRARVKGLSRHGRAWLHVSGGLGTSPYAPFRFACPPEATLLRLVPRSA
jgi:uncharacterized protein